MSLVFPPQNNDAAAIIAAVTDLAAPQWLESRQDAGAALFQHPDLAAVPSGKTVLDLAVFNDRYLKRPYRPTGTTILQSIDAMLGHIARYGDPARTVVYVDTTPQAERITAVYDAHESNAIAGHQDFRATFAMQQSEAWKAWSEADGVSMGMVDFAEFLDDRIGDVFEGTADGSAMGTVISRLSLRQATISELVALARGLAINASGKIKQAVTTSTGEISLLYEESHTDGSGAPVRIANAFLIAVPVFRGTAPIVCLVRLSYRLHAGSITWKITIHDPDAVHEYALASAVATLRAGVDAGIPVFEGVPTGPAGTAPPIFTPVKR